MKNGEDFVKDVTTDVAVAIATEGYNDVAKPAMQEMGTTAQRTVKMILAPLRGLLWCWERVEEMIDEGVSKRLKDVPTDNIKTPDPELAIPLMQSLSYTAQNETLREMFLNLLANSMNKDMDKNTHPSFVDMIGKMSTLDARVFELLVKLNKPREVIKPEIHIPIEDKMFPRAMPEWHIGFTVDGYDVFDISASLIRLNKFGLIEIDGSKVIASNEIYTILKQDKELQDIFVRQQLAFRDKELSLEISTEGVCYINDYGRQFAMACM